MTVNQVEQIADAILYEGYNLYPYRPTAIKNQHRWMFGVLCPAPYSSGQVGSDDWRMQTQCLVTGNARTVVDVNIRFLHLVDQRVYELVGEAAQSAGPPLRPTASLQVGQNPRRIRPTGFSWPSIVCCAFRPIWSVVAIIRR